MKPWLPISLLLVPLCGLVVAGSALGQPPPDLGPGDQGATLRQSSLETPARPTPPAVPMLGPWNQSLTPGANLQPAPAKKIAFNDIDINRDIEVTPEAGAWLIMLMSYTGENAPKNARSFVYELRTNYKLNAYVFNYGAEEKREAHKRAEAERERQREAMRKAGLTVTPDMKFPIRMEPIKEQTAVLIARNYRNRDEAIDDLKYRIRKLPPPDPKKVALDIQYMSEESTAPKGSPAAKKADLKAEAVYVNPFAHAFPVRNPKVKQEQSSGMPAEEVALLRQMNAEEPYSLFNCKRRYTLFIKEFKTLRMMQNSTTKAAGFMDFFSLGNGERKDKAGENAHNVAEGFRKAGLAETYVLHGKYSSYVTVGGFDAPNDPRLIAMQDFLQGRFQMESMRIFDLVPRPIPMEVPH